jgi:hypothetical protein
LRLSLYADSEISRIICSIDSDWQVGQILGIIISSLNKAPARRGLRGQMSCRQAPTSRSGTHEHLYSARVVQWEYVTLVTYVLAAYDYKVA